MHFGIMKLHACACHKVKEYAVVHTLLIEMLPKCLLLLSDDGTPQKL
jgi:hypothetical protein